MAPGFSMDSTSPAPRGSDTAEKTTGTWLSSVALCIFMATGVATPTIRSTPSARKLATICSSTAASALQFS